MFVHWGIAEEIRVGSIENTGLNTKQKMEREFLGKPANADVLHRAIRNHGIIRDEKEWNINHEERTGEKENHQHIIHNGTANHI